MKHPIVEAIRQTCDAHAKQFNYDLDAICDDLRKREEIRRADSFAASHAHRHEKEGSTEMYLTPPHPLFVKERSCG